MSLPNFIIAGAGKAGTTSLYAYSAQHPDIYVSPVKETNYFLCYGEKPSFQGPGDGSLINRVSVYERTAYESLFAGVTRETAIGEASPRYLPSPEAASRIRRDIPGCRIVIGLRQPADRAFATYVWNSMSGRDPCTTFSEAIWEEPKRRAARWSWGDYVSRGYYYEQLRRYFDLFPEDQIKVYLYEDLVNNPVGLMQDIFLFLRVDATFRPDVNKRHNLSGVLPNPLVRGLWNMSRPVRDAIRPVLPHKLREQAFQWITHSAQKPSVDAELYRELTSQYRDDILRVQDLIGRDLGHWLS